MSVHGLLDAWLLGCSAARLPTASEPKSWRWSLHLRTFIARTREWGLVDIFVCAEYKVALALANWIDKSPNSSRTPHHQQPTQDECCCCCCRCCVHQTANYTTEQNNICVPKCVVWLCVSTTVTWGCCPGACCRTTSTGTAVITSDLVRIIMSIIRFHLAGKFIWNEW